MHIHSSYSGVFFFVNSSMQPIPKNINKNFVIRSMQGIINRLERTQGAGGSSGSTSKPHVDEGRMYDYTEGIWGPGNGEFITIGLWDYTMGLGTESLFVSVRLNADIFSARLGNATSFTFTAADEPYSTILYQGNRYRVCSYAEMFYGRIPETLTSLTIVGWNSYYLTNTREMFYNCSKLETISLKGFNALEICSTKNMFYGCISLKTIELPLVRFLNGCSMEGMFWNCSALTSIQLPSMEPVEVSSIKNMINWCTALTNVDLSIISAYNESDDTHATQTVVDWIFSNTTKLTNVTMRKSLYDRLKKSESMIGAKLGEWTGTGDVQSITISH